MFEPIGTRNFLQEMTDERRLKTQEWRRKNFPREFPAPRTGMKLPQSAPPIKSGYELEFGHEKAQNPPADTRLASYVPPVASVGC